MGLLNYLVVFKRVILKGGESFVREVVLLRRIIMGKRMRIRGYHEKKWHDGSEFARIGCRMGIVRQLYLVSGDGVSSLRGVKCRMR